LKCIHFPAPERAVVKTTVALFVLLLANGAFADEHAPQGSPAREARGGGSLPPESFHVAYTRRGCRIEQNWDGVQFSASMRCPPGVRPD
jgi:hypothetical protein